MADDMAPLDPGAPAPEGRHCAWCSAPAADDATHCPSCGAALAQRADLGGVIIPGVTGVDPKLAALKDQPLRLKKGSPTQSTATPGAIAAAALVGGPLGVMAVAGMALVATEEFLAEDGTLAGVPPEKVGVPSELAWRALANVEDQEGAPRTHPADPGLGADGPVDAPPPDAPTHPDPWGRD
jgi:hypothetical protein